ncbi:hypothetical protein [Oceanobacillus profundus]|uniref:hypothetical protein n=1 Tax=Oceanobacillus TaxID=182709 RepID=UPI0026E3964A|nr:hypothetical protein [Oceanobacillus profundus]MDO6450464.1 hypothetical protein [Oceanobacillus profundus]
MKYYTSHMKKLVMQNEELQKELKRIMKEHDLEKSFALKALYHAEVAAGASGGKYQNAYRELDLPNR